MTQQKILWLNGAFGVGKTTTAKLLVKRIPPRAARARIVDPERIGLVMQHTFWRGSRDFQDIALWRRLTALRIRAAKGRAIVIVPMTIIDRNVLDDITSRISPEQRLLMIVLTAPRDVIASRIEGDVMPVTINQWRLAKLDRCLAAFEDGAFGEHVDTTGRTPEEIVERDLLPRIV